MNDNEWEEMIVVTEIDQRLKTSQNAGRVERGLSDRVAEITLNKVNVTVLKENMAGFFNQLHEILDTGKNKIGAFAVDEVKVSAQISGDGKVCLMGSGVKIGVQGGITFVLKRE